MFWLDENVEAYLLGRKENHRAWKLTDIEALVNSGRVDIEKKIASISDVIRGTEEHRKEYPNYQSPSESGNKEILAKLRAWRLDEPPPCTVKVTRKVWEYTIAGKNGFVIGFIDMLVVVQRTKLTLNNCGSDYRSQYEVPVWDSYETEPTGYFFEVKPKITSAGELIRQIRMYQEYQRGQYIVVSPDDRFASILSAQGIEFLKAPREL